MYIVKKGAEIPMPVPVIKDEADIPLVIGPDKRVPKQRFKVLSGNGGFYVYDYQKFDVVKDAEGKYFSAENEKEAYRFISTLSQTPLTTKNGNKKEMIIHE